MLRKVYIRCRQEEWNTRGNLDSSSPFSCSAIPENENLYSAYNGFRDRGVEIEPFFGFGDIDNIADLGPEVGLCGYIGDVQAALRKLNKPIPPPLDYPEELKYFLGRDIRKGTIGDIRYNKFRGFIKPVEHKLFTGFVYNGISEGDRRRIVTQSSNTEIWICDKYMPFESEYRVFILNGEILDIRRYKGKWFDTKLEEYKINVAVSKYKSAPIAYAMDVGVHYLGDTYLVEVNDAFALGTYGLNSALYCEMISERWKELVK